MISLIKKKWQSRSWACSVSRILKNATDPGIEVEKKVEFFTLKYCKKSIDTLINRKFLTNTLKRPDE